MYNIVHKNVCEEKIKNIFVGQCLTRLNETGRAREYAQKAVKLGKYEICYALLIKILVAEGDIKSAVAVSNAAVE